MKQIRFLLAVLMAFVCTTGALAQKYGVKIGGKDVTPEKTDLETYYFE